MEEIFNLIINAISSVGFPIFAACAMAWMNYKTTMAINTLTQTVDKNTDAIEALQNEFMRLTNK